MKLYIVFTGKGESKYFEGAILDYKNRVNTFCKMELKALPGAKMAKLGSVERVKESEGRAMIELVNKLEAEVVLLDERGKELSSVELSKLIQHNMNTSTKNLVFLIGGAYGFSNEVYQKFPNRLALSQLTLSHEMARLVLTEQLYRAFSILNNQPYHHE